MSDTPSGPSLPTPDVSPDLAEYIRGMVSQWPPLTPDQVTTLRALFDPVTLA
jgi:hypothetical protein